MGGRNLTGLTKEQLAIFRRRKIGFVFQSYNLVQDLNVYENIILPIELDGKREDKKFKKRSCGNLQTHFYMKTAEMRWMQGCSVRFIKRC